MTSKTIKKVFAGALAAVMGGASAQFGAGLMPGMEMKVYAAETSPDKTPQIPNGDFETWTFDGENLPNNWNSYQTSEGNYKAMVYSSSNRQVKRSDDVRPGSKGQYSCSIWSRSVLGVMNRGNLTSGSIKTGSMSATNGANYNYTNSNGSNTQNGVVNPCAMPFTGKPEAVKVWVKYVPSAGSSVKAKFSAIIHSDADYIAYNSADNDTNNNKALVVASAVKEIEYKDGEWEELTIPFEYTENGAEPAYILINAYTSSTPGKGKADDYLYIDDIEMVYAPSTVDVTGVNLNKSETTLTVDASETLTATVEPADATDKTVTWTSSNEKVATVDSNGKVTAVGAGEATITATATNGTDVKTDDKTATCKVTVKKDATAEYTNVGDYPAKFEGDAAASAWSVTVTPGSDTIENINVKVNGQSSNEGAWNGMNITGGTVVFGVAVNLAADAVNSVTAVVNDNDVDTTKVIKSVVEIL